MVDPLRSVNRRRKPDQNAAAPTRRKYAEKLRISFLWPLPLGAMLVLLWRLTPDQIEVILALIVAFSAIAALVLFMARRGAS
jgi:hypothetical protein